LAYNAVLPYPLPRRCDDAAIALILPLIISSWSAVIVEAAAPPSNSLQSDRAFAATIAECGLETANI
jgi:hypothetical protein